DRLARSLTAGLPCGSNLPRGSADPHAGASGAVSSSASPPGSARPPPPPLPPAAGPPGVGLRRATPLIRPRAARTSAAHGGAVAAHGSALDLRKVRGQQRKTVRRVAEQIAVDENRRNVLRDIVADAGSREQHEREVDQRFGGVTIERIIHFHKSSSVCSVAA